MKIDESKPKIVMTLCLLRKGNDLLMGLKKLRWGAGNYNGYGGKLEPGETLEECIKREVKEESGLDLLKYEKRRVVQAIYIGIHTFLIGNTSKGGLFLTKTIRF